MSRLARLPRGEYPNTGDLRGEVGDKKRRLEIPAQLFLRLLHYGFLWGSHFECIESDPTGTNCVKKRFCESKELCTTLRLLMGGHVYRHQDGLSQNGYGHYLKQSQHILDALMPKGAC